MFYGNIDPFRGEDELFVEWLFGIVIMAAVGLWLLGGGN